MEDNLLEEIRELGNTYCIVIIGTKAIPSTSVKEAIKNFHSIEVDSLHEISGIEDFRSLKIKDSYMQNQIVTSLERERQSFDHISEITKPKRRYPLKLLK